MSKILVAYFSAEGTTAAAAKEIAAAKGADLYEIAPAVPYTKGDLNWMDKTSRSSREMDDESCRPALANSLPDLSDYDTVVLGFPIWWYIEPRIVDTFLDGCDLSGKTVIPFATSGSSGIDQAEARMEQLCPTAHWKPGKRLTRSTAAAWAKSL